MSRRFVWMAMLMVGAGSVPAMAQKVQPTALGVRSVSPVVIAHRGACGYLPEHTQESAVYAHALGADYIEQDCVLSKDGVPVVLHDITLDRVCDVADVFPDRARDDGHWYVFDLTLAELRKLNIRERWSGPRVNRFPQGLGRFRICTLQEQIELIQGLDQSRGAKTGLYVELKGPAEHREAGLDLSQAVLQVLADFGFTGPDSHLYIQCFDATELRRVRTELKCQLPLIQLLGKPPTDEEIREYATVVDGLGVSIRCVLTGVSEGDDPQPQFTSVVRQAHQHALQVHVWTVRTDRLPGFVSSVDSLLTWLIADGGVDGVFSDQPDVVIRWRSARMPRTASGLFHLLKQPVRDSGE